MAQRYVKIFFGWPEETKELTSEEKGNLVDALVMYARGEPVDLKGNEKFLFPVFKAQIDRDAESYNVIISRNQANGSKGGRPKKNPVGFSVTQKSQDKGKGKGKGKDYIGGAGGNGDALPEAKTPRQRFAHPSTDELNAFMSDYASSKGMHIDAAQEAERFMNFYESNGWKVGRNPMKDWKAAARNWILKPARAQQAPQKPAVPIGPPSEYRSPYDLYDDKIQPWPSKARR